MKSKYINSNLYLKRLLSYFFCLLIPLVSCGQNEIEDSTIFITQIIANYSYQIPAGDMAERFGNNSSIGGEVILKNKKNIRLGFKGNFLFGDKIREEVLTNLYTSDGFVINSVGDLTDIFKFERGYSFFLTFGKLFSVLGPNKNSGLFTDLGVGFLQHKIKLLYKGDVVSQLSGDYMKGYDRLSNGLATNLSLGYSNLANNKMINFYFAVDITKAWTYNRRQFNYDTEEYDLNPRNDWLIGLKAGWILPIYKRMPKEYYFY